LTLILNRSDIALKAEKNLTNRFMNKKNYEVIFNASLRLKNSIDKLLDLARLDADGLQLTVSRVDLVSFFHNIIDFYKSMIFNSGITIIKKFPGYEIDNFYTDTEKLEEIVNNIISNAIKFVDPQKGIITIELTDYDDRVMITLTDNGIGIEKKSLDSIFNRFEQTDVGKNSSYKGTGIGLAFARQLTSLLHGSIRAESDGPGTGSSFIITLPKGRSVFKDSDFSMELNSFNRRNEVSALIKSELRDKLQDQGLAVYMNDLNKENEFDSKKGLIMIVDDNRDVREIVMEYCMSYGYTNFLIAADGKIALDAVYDNQPDIIVCDYNMPNMKGDQLHDELTSNPVFRHIPFIFLSAVANPNLVMERKRQGAVSYLKKPIDEKDLLLTIEVHLKKYMEYRKTVQMATLDELTRLHNRRSILKYLDNALAVRRYQDLSLIFIDIDHFKKFNDTWGHQTGDKVLHQIGSIINRR
jgi:CheY-like chemotaxis protein/anti-sigma regulatory factor (Ser/Thr protein kinase)